MLEGSPCHPCPAPGPTTGLERPHSKMGNAQEFQRWKPDEQPQLAVGLTRGFKIFIFFFSQTAATISFCSAQGVTDVVFMPGLHLTFPHSFSAFSHCCLKTPTMVLVAAASPKYPIMTSSGECLATKSHFLATSKWPEWWCSL